MEQNRPLKNPLVKKLLTLLLLILLLQVPIVQISQLTQERSTTRTTALRELERASGGIQIVASPSLAVPIMQIAPQEEIASAQEIRQSSAEIRRSSAALAPKELAITATSHTELRYRGIYSLPYYVAKIHLQGHFELPPDSRPIEAEEGIWVVDRKKQLTLMLEVKNPNSLRIQPVALVNEERATLGVPVHIDSHHPGMLQANIAPPAGDKIPFSIDFEVTGAEALKFSTFAGITHVNIVSDWKNLSFIGEFLPGEKSEENDQFKASWKIPRLTEGLIDTGNRRDLLSDGLFGVEFMSPLDVHRMVQRAVKYEALIVVLAFLAFFLFEVASGNQIHAVQYLFLGAALVLFYLLLLSIAELSGFTLAYILAAGIVICMMTGYSRVILHRHRHSWIVAAYFSSFYAFTYSLLTEQDYSLLLGSLGLTLILAAIMYFTRNIDWFAFEQGLRAPKSPETQL